MGTLLLKHATRLVTMDEARREIIDGGIFARDGIIESVGPTGELPDHADEVVDLSDHVVLPGFVNTHHHLYQTLTRAFPGAQDTGLFEWLTTLYPVWARMTPRHIQVSTKVGLAELALTGCTTAFDHTYIWPNGARLDDQFEAAGEIGLRFHGSRGSMSLGESDGGLPPDDVVEDERDILDDTIRVIDAFHDGAPGSMNRVVVAPCSPFSVTLDAMRDAVALARSRGLTLHTHLAETMDEEVFCLETFGLRPVELMEDLGWVGPDVWWAHAVFVDPTEIGRMAVNGTGVAHCPTSNMRLGSGIAPVRGYRDAGVRVGLGVDGSASNDSSNLLGEARQAMLLARLAASPQHGEPGPMMPAREALEIATLGGAAVLGRDDIGALRIGACADFTAIRLDRVEMAGGLHDPVAAALLCAPGGVDETWVHGRRVVSGGRLVTAEVPSLVEEQNRLAAGLFG